MPIESVMPSNHLILCRPLLLRLQSFWASGSFQMSHLFASGGQSIGVSASASVLPMNTQDWSPLGWTGWISLQSKGFSRVFSNNTVQKHQLISRNIRGPVFAIGSLGEEPGCGNSLLGKVWRTGGPSTLTRCSFPCLAPGRLQVSQLCKRRPVKLTILSCCSLELAAAPGDLLEIQILRNLRSSLDLLSLTVLI